MCFYPREIVVVIIIIIIINCYSIIPLNIISQS